MCPFVALLVLVQLLYLICDVTSVRFNIKMPTQNSTEWKLYERTQDHLNYSLDDIDDFKLKPSLKFNIRDPKVAIVDRNFIELYQISDTHAYKDVINVTGKSIGFTKLDIIYETKSPDANKSTVLKTIDILIMYEQDKVLSNVFTVLVAVLVTLNIVNMGCAVETQVIKDTVRRPTALLIGFFTHYFFMPLFAYVIGRALFEDVPYLRLSLFIFGSSPGGSAANMWTVLLGGNLNLSITLTFFSTLLAVIMMPLWLFAYGNQTFGNSNIEIPFSNILRSLFVLTIGVSLGILIQKYKPRLAQKSKKILAPVSGFLIIFIILFASYCFWYLFKLMSWQIILAATLKVWLGFVVGAIFGAMCGQKFEDVISITVETGIQNTGIVFFILRALPSPYSDYALTVPVAGSCVTAIPLTVLFLIMKCRKRSQKKFSDSNQTICNSETVPIRSKEPVQLNQNV